MNGFVANTDFEWLASVRDLEADLGEVIFWRAGTERFRALQPGEPFFFKLKSPHDGIAGFGFFSHFAPLPLSVAWRLGRSANGAPTEREMRERLNTLRSRIGLKTPARGDQTVGCILVNHPFFFEEGDLIPVPSDFVANVGQGKRYDLKKGEGRKIWTECRARMERRNAGSIREAPLGTDRRGRRRGTYLDSAALAVSRLGSLSFATAVIEKYRSRCALTEEASLPALQVAMIRRFGDASEYSVNNGILLRADIAGLFESGWVTITPDFQFRVSQAVLENEEKGSKIGVDWSELDGKTIRVPRLRRERPLSEALWWHNEKQFIG